MAGRARRRLQLARGRARAPHRRRRRGLAERGPPRREAFRVALRSCSRRGAAELATRSPTEPPLSRVHARELRDSLAADYTYLQAAQPTTAGHLLLAYAYPALRDAERLRDAHRELSRSVAGVGGSAGSRWPLDRARLAELLGCDGLVQHAKDAAWQWDVYAELLSALAISATHLSQLAQDFEIYASHEFGLIELADQHSRASALMPQKRNPYALAAIRAQAGQAAGDVAAALDRHAPARRAPTTSTSSTASSRARSRRPARSRASRPPCSRACASMPAAWRASRARASRTRPTSPTCSRPRRHGLPHGAQGRRPRRPPLTEQGAGRAHRRGRRRRRPGADGRDRRGRSRHSSTRRPVRRRASSPARRRARRWRRCSTRWTPLSARERAWARERWRRRGRRAAPARARCGTRGGLTAAGAAVARATVRSWVKDMPKDRPSKKRRPTPSG